MRTRLHSSSCARSLVALSLHSRRLGQSERNLLMCWCASSRAVQLRAQRAWVQVEQNQSLAQRLCYAGTRVPGFRTWKAGSCAYSDFSCFVLEWRWATKLQPSKELPSPLDETVVIIIFTQIMSAD
jgi:hypothetical protein